MGKARRWNDRERRDSKKEKDGSKREMTEGVKGRKKSWGMKGVAKEI